MPAELITFESLYSDYFRRMIAFVSTFRGLSEAEVEDLAHDILVHAWFKKERFDGSRPLNAWIYELAGNYVINYLRSKKIVFVSLDEQAIGMEAAENDTFFESCGTGGETGYAGAESGENIQSSDSELIELIKKEIRAMEVRDRQIAMLVFFEHMSGAETSRVMGIPGATVRWRLAAIRKRLQKVCREAR